jgi:hypothetical protein
VTVTNPPNQRLTPALCRGSFCLASTSSDAVVAKKQHKEGKNREPNVRFKMNLKRIQHGKQAFTASSEKTKAYVGSHLVMYQSFSVLLRDSLHSLAR